MTTITLARAGTTGAARDLAARAAAAVRILD